MSKPRDTDVEGSTNRAENSGARRSGVVSMRPFSDPSPHHNAHPSRQTSGRCRGQSAPWALCLDVLRLSSGEHSVRQPHDAGNETVMTIDQGVGQGVVKIRTSRYELIQPFAMAGFYFVLAASHPRGLAPFWLMGPVIVALARWALTWGVDLIDNHRPTWPRSFNMFRTAPGV